MTTLADVLAFIKTADNVDKTAIRAVLNMPFHTGPLPHDAGEYGVDRNFARAILAGETLSKIDVGNEVTFPYNGVEYTGQVVKINRLTAKVRITKMSGPPTKKGVTVGANVKVSASILARSL